MARARVPLEHGVHAILARTRMRFGGGFKDSANDWVMPMVGIKKRADGRIAVGSAESDNRFWYLEGEGVPMFETDMLRFRREGRVLVAEYDFNGAPEGLDRFEFHYRSTAWPGNSDVRNHDFLERQADAVADLRGEPRLARGEAPEGYRPMVPSGTVSGRDFIEYLESRLGSEGYIEGRDDLRAGLEFITGKFTEGHMQSIHDVLARTRMRFGGYAGSGDGIPTLRLAERGDMHMIGPQGERQRLFAVEDLDETPEYETVDRSVRVESGTIVTSYEFDVPEGKGPRKFEFHYRPESFPVGFSDVNSTFFAQHFAARAAAGQSGYFPLGGKSFFPYLERMLSLKPELDTSAIRDTIALRSVDPRL